MIQYCYFPLLKTRDAELKAISKLNDKYFDHILPIYELTKSRKTKIAPDGDIHRKMTLLNEIHGKRPFILDVTSNEKYLNYQLEQLLDESNAFYEWQYFINLYSDMNIIPMIHLYDEDNFTEVEQFVKEISRTKDYLAVRLPYDLDSYKKYITPIVNNLSKTCKLYVILDGEQVIKGLSEDIIDGFSYACSELEEFSSKIADIITICTSFPLSPASEGKDDHGSFPIVEEMIFKNISKEYAIKYGDYGSINIQQIEIKGGTFVPRIDIALDEEFIYKRYRRNAGSYILCAKKMMSDTRYIRLDTWADDEIKSAAEGNPSGISPSYWIAVRMNYYMSSRVKLRFSE
ncbi:beta family protein [Pectobacterium versatile]|uniref:beta family protein n=1 Tax=Pectobacterium versatile TaxID=2488639 RepID=UPI0019693B8B|nr:beta family protein [Pectobacterium versatile]MBN3239836.1 beta family protein [Pectobacterium versatile]